MHLEGGALWPRNYILPPVIDNKYCFKFSQKVKIIGNITNKTFCSVQQALQLYRNVLKHVKAMFVLPQNGKTGIYIACFERIV